ncbi:asparagine synthase (glutamine-hydrolyzing) [Erwinia sp. ErVv1]|uniref:asparagine synthase (glutamine-hydrolyzing) n=1 Tax=Erwinia sp. ErVv1 TaxID=1603299 RepID=UPI00082FF819|nr:asparagine synthase (glutamine-hydrolyzing) [Erwinia sp. ErVv1]
MCGIAALYGTSDAGQVELMLSQIQHRGPDETHATVTERCAFGINRLSIMDIEGGSQPFHIANGTVHLVCNGQIYNHAALRADLENDVIFSSGSDVEVIAHLYHQYGAELLPRLDGMFAFFIYDQHRQDFLAARDRFGIKPLYYLQRDGAWFFASEIKALQALSEDAALIKELPPGWMATSEGIRPWFDINMSQRRSVPDTRLVRALLEASVEKHMQADPQVKFGVFLSGGLDSSIIAALAARHRQDLVALTIGMPGSPDTIAARQVASHLGIRLVECSFTVTQALAQLRRAVQVTESYNSVMVLEGLMTMQLAQAAAEEGIKVILSGEGADEIFAGYGLLRCVPPARLSGQLKQLLGHLHKTECRRLDRATMACSVEARVPFLDPLLVEYAVNLPASGLIQKSSQRPTEKWLLREACRDLLPENILQRVKLAFDHGSGILALLDTLADRVTDAAFEETRYRYPAARIANKPTLVFYFIWRDIFGETGGAGSFELCGHYPVMQEMIDKRTSETGGTGECEEDITPLLTEWTHHTAPLHKSRS